MPVAAAIEQSSLALCTPATELAQLCHAVIDTVPPGGRFSELTAALKAPSSPRCCALRDLALFLLHRLTSSDTEPYEAQHGAGARDTTSFALALAERVAVTRSALLCMLLGPTVFAAAAAETDGSRAPASPFFAALRECSAAFLAADASRCSSLPAAALRLQASLIIIEDISLSASVAAASGDDGKAGTASSIAVTASASTGTSLLDALLNPDIMRPSLNVAAGFSSSDASGLCPSAAASADKSCSSCTAGIACCASVLETVLCVAHSCVAAPSAATVVAAETPVPAMSVASPAVTSPATMRAEVLLACLGVLINLTNGNAAGLAAVIFWLPAAAQDDEQVIDGAAPGLPSALRDAAMAIAAAADGWRAPALGCAVTRVGSLSFDTLVLALSFLTNCAEASASVRQCLLAAQVPATSTATGDVGKAQAASSARGRTAQLSPPKTATSRRPAAKSPSRLPNGGSASGGTSGGGGGSDARGGPSCHIGDGGHVSSVPFLRVLSSLFVSCHAAFDASFAASAPPAAVGDAGESAHARDGLVLASYTALLIANLLPHAVTDGGDSLATCSAVLAAVQAAFDGASCSGAAAAGAGAATRAAEALRFVLRAFARMQSDAGVLLPDAAHHLAAADARLLAVERALAPTA